MAEANQNNKVNELVITRIFDAPRAVVWKYWTEPEYFKKWWGPKIFTCPVSKIDFRVGGKYLHCMQWPDGKRIWSGGVYKEIVPLEKIVCTDSFADENGNVISAKEHGLPVDFPKEMEVTVTFEEQDGKTKLTVRQKGMPETMSGMANIGWNESFDKLAEHLRK